MAEIISCPACQRKLQVPEEYFGQTVQCPECKHTFIAAPPGAPVSTAPQPAKAASPPPPAPEKRAPEWEKPPPSRSSRRDDEDYDEDEEDEEDDRPRRRRRRRYADEDDEDRPLRRYVTPHRGGMILTFGILAIMGFCAPVFGPMAWVMGSTDLAQMRTGSMDREGEGLTQAGRILGMVATIIFICFVLFICLITMANATNRRF